MAADNSAITDLIRSVFDALPSPIFVVDDDVMIQEFNEAAAAFLAVQRSSVIKRRGGDVLPSCQRCAGRVWPGAIL